MWDQDLKCKICCNDDERQRSILRLHQVLLILHQLNLEMKIHCLQKAKILKKLIKEIIPRKIELNMEYIKNMSVIYDIG